MSRREKATGFTVIELLIAIAIVAVLAAIIMPVLARAKEAAKKSTCASNVRQFGLAMQLYTGDYDDTYARADGCEPLTGSLNPAHRVPGSVPGDGCSNYPFAYRVNHYKWPKWLLHYSGNDWKLYTCPSREKDQIQWDDNGELHNAYALNLALTGALNTWGNPNRLGAYRNSFLGGRSTNVPDPSSAMLFMELSSSTISFVPVFTTPSATRQTAYPVALRNLWAPYFMRWTSRTDCTPTNEVDPKLIPHNEVFVIGRADGSAKAITAKQFLAETPTTSDYIVPPYASGWQCGPTSGSRTIATRPTWNREWPMWALY